MQNHPNNYYNQGNNQAYPQNNQFQNSPYGQNNYQNNQFNNPYNNANNNNSSNQNKFDMVDDGNNEFQSFDLKSKNN